MNTSRSIPRGCPINFFMNLPTKARGFLWCFPVTNPLRIGSPLYLHHGPTLLPLHHGFGCRNFQALFLLHNLRCRRSLYFQEFATINPPSASQNGNLQIYTTDFVGQTVLVPEGFPFCLSRIRNICPWFNRYLYIYIYLFIYIFLYIYLSISIYLSI